MKRSKGVFCSLAGCLLVLALFITGCDLGSMLSADWIRSATANNVVNIGDSIFALSGAIHNDLKTLAGKTFRNYCVSGANFASDNVATTNDVADQYAIAKGDSSVIKTVLMDGGGNDILIPYVAFDPYNCKVDWWESGLSSTCKALVDDVYVDAVDLINQMGRDGVQNVIWMGYYNLKNGLIGCTGLNQAVAYGDTKLALAVANATAGPASRIFVDPRSTIVASDIKSDGVHPTDAGSQKLANLIWPILKTRM
jgi:hypothetical protein